MSEKSKTQENSPPSTSAAEPSPSTALVKVVDEESRLMSKWATDAPIMKSNLDLVGQQGRAIVTKALGNADKKAGDVVGQVLHVVGYLAHPATLIDNDTGEEYNKVRVVMVLRDDTTVSCMSEGVVRVLRFVSQVMENKRWDPPVRFLIESHALEKGRRYFTMRELTDDEVQAIAKSKGK